MKARKRTNGSGKIINSDRIFDVIIMIMVIFLLAIVLYPIYLVLICSVSDANLVTRGQVYLYPKGVTFAGYDAVLENAEIWRAYLNSIIYTFVGTLFSIVFTMGAAYALTRRFMGKKIVSFILVFTMFFNGGLIPTFLVMRNIGLYNNPLILILMGCVSVWNIMVARTYISTNLPDELFEAAIIDGANHFVCFWKLVIPLSGTIIAVLTVYYGIARWNDYYNGLIYITTRSYLPLQTILKEILASLEVGVEILAMSSDSLAQDAMALQKAQVAKYCVIVVSTGPAVILYVFMQKFFVKGIMVGSLKG